MLSVNELSYNEYNQLLDAVRYLKDNNISYIVYTIDSIGVYSTDERFSVLKRTQMPNITPITGTIAFKASNLSQWSKIMIPGRAISIISPLFQRDNASMIQSRMVYDEITIPKDVFDGERLGLVYDMNYELSMSDMLSRISGYIETSMSYTDYSEEYTDAIKDKVSSMRADDGSQFHRLDDTHIISLYTGLLPINKGDKLSLRVYESITDFLCVYTVYKGKKPPIEIYVKQMRL